MAIRYLAGLIDGSVDSVIDSVVYVFSSSESLVAQCFLKCAGRLGTRSATFYTTHHCSSVFTGLPLVQYDNLTVLVPPQHSASFVPRRDCMFRSLRLLQLVSSSAAV